MTPHQILIVALRIAAVLWFLHAISHVAGSAMEIAGPNSDPRFTSIVLSLASLELIACIFMWVFPATIAAWLLPSGATQSAVLTPELSEWQTMGIILVGLLVLSDSIPGVVYWVADFLTRLSDLPTEYLFSSYVVASLASTIANLIIGLWLLLGAQGFVIALFRFRTAGLRP